MSKSKLKRASENPWKKVLSTQRLNIAAGKACLYPAFAFPHLALCHFVQTVNTIRPTHLCPAPPAFPFRPRSSRLCYRPANNTRQNCHSTNGLVGVIIRILLDSIIESLLEQSIFLRYRGLFYFHVFHRQMLFKFVTSKKHFQSSLFFQ